jgi:hypothetical protein
VISAVCRVLEVTALAWNHITQAVPWVSCYRGHWQARGSPSPTWLCAFLLAPAPGGSRAGTGPGSTRAGVRLGWVGWQEGRGLGLVGSGGQGGGGAKQRAAPAKQPLGPTSPVLLAPWQGFARHFFIPLPFLACDMKHSPGNGVPHLRNSHWPYRWTGHKSSSCFSDLAPLILHCN